MNPSLLMIVLLSVKYTPVFEPGSPPARCHGADTSHDGIEIAAVFMAAFNARRPAPEQHPGLPQCLRFSPTGPAECHPLPGARMLQRTAARVGHGGHLRLKR
jgi:hypothetical protein